MRDFQQTPVAEEAIGLVTGDRQATYGDPIASHARIGNLWTALLGPQLTEAITPRQVACMMILMKVSRDQAVHHRDNEVDICGYALILQMEREAQEVTTTQASPPMPMPTRAGSYVGD